MVQNLSQGPVQIHSLDVSSINLALIELFNRQDKQAGLRGRSEVWDRLRADDPSAASDAVTLGVIGEGESVANISFLTSVAGLCATPGTTYAELATTLRRSVNFASPQGLEARVLVSGWGTESGSGKGVAVTQTDGTVLAAVTWDGATEGAKTGTFTAITLTTTQDVQIRVKGSSSTETLVLTHIALDLRYDVSVI